jgi:hypothetical protein
MTDFTRPSVRSWWLFYRLNAIPFHVPSKGITPGLIEHWTQEVEDDTAGCDRILSEQYGEEYASLLLPISAGRTASCPRCDMDRTHCGCEPDEWSEGAAPGAQHQDGDTQ